MQSIERELNEYLFLEFGMDDEEEDAGSISATWPFNLRRLGEIGDSIIFEFDDADKQYFAIGGPCLSVLPKSGMTIDDLALQFAGSDWIASQDPVSLEESRPGDDSIPSGLERQRALQELGRDVTGDPDAEIMAGLFLRKSGRYLGLFRVPNKCVPCNRSAGSCWSVQPPISEPLELWRCDRLNVTPGLVAPITRRTSSPHCAKPAT